MTTCWLRSTVVVELARIDVGTRDGNFAAHGRSGFRLVSCLPFGSGAFVCSSLDSAINAFKAAGIDRCFSRIAVSRTIRHLRNWRVCCGGVLSTCAGDNFALNKYAGMYV